MSRRMTEFDDRVAARKKVSRHADKWFVVTLLQLVSLVVVLVCMETQYHPVHWFLFVSQFVSSIGCNYAAHYYNYAGVAMAWHHHEEACAKFRRYLKEQWHV